MSIDADDRTEERRHDLTLALILAGLAMIGWSLSDQAVATYRQLFAMPIWRKVPDAMYCETQACGDERT